MNASALSDTEFLRRLRAELGRAYHDLSNPLAIVSGNLELAAELRRAGASMDEVADSLSDAHAAVDGFTEPLQRLLAIRKLIDERLVEIEGR